MTAIKSQILTVTQMRAAEQVLIDRGETVEDLMQRAGCGAAEYVRRVAAGRSVTVLCGPGNNGGDGYVIARVLREGGLAVEVVAPTEPKTKAAMSARHAAGADNVSRRPDPTANRGVFVDCLFGSGLSRPLDEAMADDLKTLAAQHEYCIAVDLPSGMDSDSGATLNERLPRYDLTIALGAWKFAHWLMPAMDYMGERRLVNIGIGPVAEAGHLVERPRLAAPAADAHKYSRGLLGIVGGAMPGAGVLAARAAMHSGAGYVKLFAEHRSPATPDELVVDGAPLAEVLSDGRIDALLVGPGLGRDDWSRSRLVHALSTDVGTVCDADALALVGPQMIEDRTTPLIVTPHAGELAALCETFENESQARVQLVSALAARMRAVVVAKGPDTLIAAPDGALFVAPPSTSWLSTAGTGDVLAGIVASRLAVTGDPLDAAKQAVWLHGEAARMSRPVFSAGALIEALPAAFAACL